MKLRPRIIAANHAEVNPRDRKETHPVWHESVSGNDREAKIQDGHRPSTTEMPVWHAEDLQRRIGEASTASRTAGGLRKNGSGRCGCQGQGARESHAIRPCC